MKFLSSEKLSPHKYKTPEGYLICTDAILARTGKQTYRKNEVFADSEDDSEIDVDRKPEEVFSPKTLASFENKPITVEHPDEDVNAGNYNELSVGFVRDVKRGQVDGQDVMLGTLVITDAQAIEEIENGEHTDLSCGYDCDIIDEANPQQRNIRGNHVALCQQGRAGIARIVDSVKVDDSKYEIGQLVHHNLENYTGRVIKKVNDFYYIRVTASKPESDYQPGDIVVEKEYNLKDSIKDDYFTSLPDKVKKSEFNDLYYKIREKAEDKWNYRVSTYGDKFKIEIEKAVGAAPGTYGPVGGQWKTVKTIYSIEDSIRDDKSVETTSNEIHAFKSDNQYRVSVWNKNNLDYDAFKNIARKYGVEIYASRLGSDYLDILSSDKNKIYKAFGEINSRYPNGSWKILDTIADAEMIKVNGVNMIVAKSKEEIPERTHFKQEVQYNGKAYYWHEGFDTKRNYLVPIKDSSSEELAQREYDKLKKDLKALEAEIDRNDNNPNYNMKNAIDRLDEIQNKIYKLKQQFSSTLHDDLVHNYTKQDLDLAQEMLANASSDREKELIQGLITDIKFELHNQQFEDKLVESGSEEAFKKNIATEIKSGKDPKQAAAIAYSVKRKNDSKKYEISYVKDNIEHIHVVKANSLQDAIKKAKTSQRR